nr:MAG TPA: hypothetical protein [Caudoviricetes sp.]
MNKEHPLYYLSRVVQRHICCVVVLTQIGYHLLCLLRYVNPYLYPWSW